MTRLIHNYIQIFTFELFAKLGPPRTNSAILCVNLKRVQSDKKTRQFSTILKLL